MRLEISEIRSKGSKCGGAVIAKELIDSGRVRRAGNTRHRGRGARHRIVRDGERTLERGLSCRVHRGARLFRRIDRHAENRRRAVQRAGSRRSNHNLHLPNTREISLTSLRRGAAGCRRHCNRSPRCGQCGFDIVRTILRNRSRLIGTGEAEQANTGRAPQSGSRLPVHSHSRSGSMSSSKRRSLK